MMVGNQAWLLRYGYIVCEVVDLKASSNPQMQHRWTNWSRLVVLMAAEVRCLVALTLGFDITIVRHSSRDGTRT